MLACNFNAVTALFQLETGHTGIRKCQKFSKQFLVFRTWIKASDHFLIFTQHGIFMITVGNNHICQIFCGICYRFAWCILQELGNQQLVLEHIERLWRRKAWSEFNSIWFFIFWKQSAFIKLCLFTVWIINQRLWLYLQSGKTDFIFISDLLSYKLHWKTYRCISRSIVKFERLIQWNIITNPVVKIVDPSSEPI